MNSNRTRYASTPTYGMQKRNFAKKQAAAQPNPTPDFTQQPALEENPPIAAIPAQNPFSAVPNAYSGMPIPPANGNSQIFQPSVPLTPMMSPTVSPAFNAGAPVSSYPGFPPMPASPQSSAFRPLGNSMPSGQNGALDPRSQGFVPPAYPAGSAPQGMYNSANPASCAVPPAVSVPSGLYQAPGSYSGAVSPGYSPYATNGMPAYGNGLPPMMNGGSMMPPTGNGGGGSFTNPPYQGGFGGSPASPTPRPPFDLDKLLKLLMYGALPVLFIPCVFVTHTFDFLRYLFIILSVITLSVVWYRQSFSSGIRTTLSVVYLALCIIVIAFLVGGTKADLTQPSSDQRSQAAAQTSAAPADTVTPEPEAQETPPPEVDEGESESEARLSTFMDYWSSNNFEQMANLVLPSWAAKQSDPASALFTIISNRTPQKYTIEGIAGVPGDSSRTVTMSAYIDKNNGKDPVRYRFMILMVNEQNEWYVDPNSLATNETVDATATPEPGKATVAQSLAPRMTVTPVPAADTKLYYNANGGKYYHVDPNCSAVNSKYLPMASFLYSDLGKPPYNSLQPCLKCGAPTQALSDVESGATATPQPDE